MRVIKKYQCENCYETFSYEDSIHNCTDCDKEVCLYCSDIVNSKYYCVSCGLKRRVNKSETI